MILAVTGLAREARIVSRPDIHVAAGGGDSRNLRDRIERALDAGARRIISMGVCGALAPSLKVGDCVVATEIVAGKETFNTHRSWTRELLARLPHAQAAVLSGSDDIVADRAAKARLHRETGAAVADMESHVAARIAAERDIPFAAIRVVSDCAARTLPPAALVGMAKCGGVDVRAVLGSLARNPWQMPALVRTAFEAEVAFRVLARCRHVLDAALPSQDLELSLDVT